MTQPLTNTDAFSSVIIEFERQLPGWWWRVGTCSVSRHASCGPDRAGPDAHLLEIRLFDAGFDCDDYREGSTLAGALLDVMSQALKAKARHTAGAA
jgi:hypothetical protein